jgi:TorA maturation chaperone TorD
MCAHDTDTWAKTWQLRAQLYSFLGNSLLEIMSETTAAVSFSPGFWENFPLEAANDDMQAALANLIAITRELAALPPAEALKQIQLEYTRLFIGPGAPAAPPWESLYREGGTTLFGQPTFDMRQLYASHGLKVEHSTNNQLEDHLGLELLFLASVGERFSQEAPTSQLIQEQRDFIDEHPLSWIDQLHAKAAAATAPLGTTTATEHKNARFYPQLILLIKGFLLWDRALLGEYSDDSE